MGKKVIVDVIHTDRGPLLQIRRETVIVKVKRPPSEEEVNKLIDQLTEEYQGKLVEIVFLGDQ
jgi:hypothetical protein